MIRQQEVQLLILLYSVVDIASTDLLGDAFKMQLMSTSTSVSSASLPWLIAF